MSAFNPPTIQPATPPVAVAAAPSDPWGVILLGHGSQRGASPRECSCAWRMASAAAPESPDWPTWCRRCPSTPQGLGEVARRLPSALASPAAAAPPPVLLSCLEFIEPHPEQAVRLLSEQGVGNVVVMPYLLGNGKHATLEMDEMLDEVRARLPQVQLHLADGLGADARIADLVVERISDLGTAAPLPAPGRSVGILLVKAGTRTQYDDCQWLAQLGQMVENRLGLGYAVDVAQSHYGDPTMEFAAARLVSERGVSAIICVPYIFFPGLILTRNVLGTMDQLQSQYPGLTMAIAPPLGVDDRLIAVAADRIREIQNRAALP